MIAIQKHEIEVEQEHNEIMADLQRAARELTAMIARVGQLRQFLNKDDMDHIYDYVINEVRNCTHELHDVTVGVEATEPVDLNDYFCSDCRRKLSTAPPRNPADKELVYCELCGEGAE
jgi:hypothetical protein